MRHSGVLKATMALLHCRVASQFNCFVRWPASAIYLQARSPGLIEAWSLATSHCFTRFQLRSGKTAL